ncbi:MAG: hypothetical protein JJU12_06400 [Chlamydiales bacterium]|nr:hypothetical protein [Chlamydiales bacterium]
MLRIGAKRELFYRKRERGFSFDALKGIALSLIVHLALFFGLRITSPPNFDALLPLSPVAVEVDLGTPRTLRPPAQIVFSPIEQIEPPRLLDMPEITLSVELLPLYHYTRIPEPDFSEIEKIPYKYLENLEDD